MLKIFTDFQNLTNPALRLKDSVIAEEKKRFDASHGQNEDTLQLDDATSDKLKWQYFDELKYTDKTRIRPGQDAYQRNKFNQAASDKLKSNRDVPDTRHTR